MTKYLLAMAVSLLVAACAAGVPLAPEGQQAPGLLVFNGHTESHVDCYRCHNGNGRGTHRGPDLADVVPELDDAQLAHVIDHGALFMPAYAGKMSAAEQAELIAWLRESFGGPPSVKQ